MTAADREKLLADVEAFCQEVRPHEELCYVEHGSTIRWFRWRKHNILGMLTPAEYGGRGAGRGHLFASMARIGREGTGVRTFFSGHMSIGAYPILTWGTPDQKQRYLPAACRGEKILAFGLTEPDAGSNPLEMTTTYERRGDKYILNGVKYLISNGGIADAVICFGYPANATAGARGGFRAFIVDTKAPGFLPRPDRQDGHADLEHRDVRDDAMPKCRLNNMLGGEGDGFRIAMGTLVSGRLSVAAGCLGVIEDCLAEAINYAKERQQHGKPIARHQLGAGAHRRDRDGSACDRSHRHAGGRGQGRGDRQSGRCRNGKAGRYCSPPRPSYSPPTRPGTPPTGRCRSSAAAAGPRSIARAGT